MGELTFLTPNAREAFNQLRLAFTQDPILWHFNPEYHIWIKIDTSGYAIGGVLSQLISNPNWIATKEPNSTKLKFLSKSDSR